MSDSSNTSAVSAARSTGTASGEKVGLHQPSHDKHVEDKLGNVDLDSRGAKVHDHLRDKRGNGVPGYDDSIEHDAESKYTQGKAASPSRD